MFKNLKSKSLLIIILSLACSIIIRELLVVTSTQVADVLRMHQVAQTVVKGINPYLIRDFYIYPPVWMFIEGFSLQMVKLLNIPFQVSIKFWPNLADILIFMLIYKFLLKEKLKPVNSAFWASAFILNPVSIIVSSAHGQFDSVVSLFVIGAIYLLTFAKKKTSFYLSALLVGIAIAIKPNPAMLVPLFVLFKKTELKEKILYLVLAGLPVFLTLLPFLATSFSQTLQSVFGYSGVGDFGLAAVIRGIWYQTNASLWPPSTPELLTTTKVSFLFGSIFIFTLFSGFKNLAGACVALYLLFFSVYFGISAQYLSWVIPLMALARDRKLFLFSLVATVSLASFYLFFNPEILLGVFANIQAFQSQYMQFYLASNLLLWLSCIILLVIGVRRMLLLNYQKFSRPRKMLTLVSLGLFFVSLIPTGFLVVAIFN